MRVGDMVVRAYAWERFIPGIIVDVEIELVESGQEGTDDYFQYEDHSFIIQWSDGTQTSEMDCEVIPLGPAIEDQQRWAKETFT